MIRGRERVGERHDEAKCNCSEVFHGLFVVKWRDVTLCKCINVPYGCAAQSKVG